MEKVLVMMSTYNGGKYIREQLDSIFSQEDVDCKVLIRDDGSTDNTKEIIKSYGDRVELIEGENLKSAKSFLSLMRYANEYYQDYDYFSLADQDDIWMSDKLERGILALKNNNGDLYCGALDAFIDGDKNSHYVIECQNYSAVESMLRNSAAGCGMVMSKKVIERISEYNPDFIEMHDSWIFRICKYTNLNIIFDSNPCMRYRIHGNNTCGAAISKGAKIKSHLKNVFKRDPNLVSLTANELLCGYKDMMSKDTVSFLEVLDRSTGIKFRKLKLLKYALNGEFSTKTRKIDFIIEVLFGTV